MKFTEQLCFAGDLLTIDRIAERRQAARIVEPFPVRVRGVDAFGERFDVDTVLDNLSAGGLYLRLMRSVRDGTTLFLVVEMSFPHLSSSPRIAIRGEAIRVLPLSRDDCACGVAVRISRHRFI